MNLLEYIKKAEIEGMKRDLKANCVLINKQLELIERSWAHMNIDGTVNIYPPMICGLASYLTDELPEDTAFAIFRAENLPPTREQEIKQQAREELLDELREMSFSKVIEMLHRESEGKR